MDCASHTPRQCHRETKIVRKRSNISNMYMKEKEYSSKKIIIEKNQISWIDKQHFEVEIFLKTMLSIKSYNVFTP